MKKELRRVEINKIRPRKENNYGIRGIVELADSISKTGLIHPIIITPYSDDHGIYRIVDGERRYRALNLLHSRAKEKGNSALQIIYQTIDAFVVYDISPEEENHMYRDSNDYARQLTNFERIVRMDPDQIDLHDEKWQNTYISLVYGQEGKEAENNSEKGDIHIKATRRAKSKLIRLLMLQSEPELDISEKTIRNYLAFLDRCSPELRSAAVMGTISIRDAQKLSWLSQEEQKEAVEQKDEETYSDYVLEGEYLSGKKEREKETANKTEEKLIKLYSKKLKRICADYLKAKGRITEKEKGNLSTEEEITKNEIEKIMDEIEMMH